MQFSVPQLQPPLAKSPQSPFTKGGYKGKLHSLACGKDRLHFLYSAGMIPSFKENLRNREHTSHDQRERGRS